MDSPQIWRMRFAKALVAVLSGTFLYFFILEPRLPPAARHEPFQIDLGLVLAFWVCLALYGVVELAWRWARKQRPTE